MHNKKHARHDRAAYDVANPFSRPLEARGPTDERGRDVLRLAEEVRIVSLAGPSATPLCVHHATQHYMRDTSSCPSAVAVVTSLVDGRR